MVLLLVKRGQLLDKAMLSEDDRSQGTKLAFVASRLQGMD